MATPFLIIDGYNLMHAAGIARRQYAQGDMQKCRNELELRMAGLLAEPALKRTTIVYDAFNSPGNDQRIFHRKGLKVVFAPAGQDADGEIERLLSAHSAPKQVIVVSSDHRLHKAARRRKARCIDSGEFLTQIEKEPRPTSRRHGSGRGPDINETAAELREWEQVFEGQSPPPPQKPHGFDADYLADLEDDLRNNNL
ncbi:MAG: NYN domain-containing protein [Planctomycetaceae bacterium]|nr:NYN domain-containing protein [Planctomycetaceae bacterium]